MLIEMGTVDTVYRDVYLDRARTLLGGALSLDDFLHLVQQQAELGELPLAIARAVDKANWVLVKELSGRGQAIRRTVEDKHGLIETAREIYAVTDVRLDPFSPGLQRFVHLPTKDVTAVRHQAIEQLGALAGMDPSWRAFYGERRAAFQALVVANTEQATAAAFVDPAGDPRQAALEALKRGDMSRLEKLADTLMGAVGARTGTRHSAEPSGSSTPAPQQPVADLLFAYSADTLTRARRLGLAARRMESRAEIASLREFAWDPRFPDESGRVGVKQVPLPGGTPEAFRERLEMSMIHPLVNSGGARHLPKLVAEDVLIEDFPDLEDGAQAPASDLLAQLGLPGRLGLPRIAIEQALLAHGARVVGQELGLDPRAFRLVCIPPDVHLRLGEAEGWGRQPFWTHFDGYLVMADGRLRALAGGHVQFGGLFDLLGLSRDYDSDHLLTRFAVVRRERMVAW
jgi:hypothetical protein